MTKKYVSTWDAMKMSASPEEMRELNEIELKSLKDRQMFHSSTPAEERKNIMKNNRELRKEAKKILKAEDEVKRFMETTNFDEYLNISKIPMTRDTLEPSFESPEPSMGLKNSPVEVRGLDTIVYKGDPDPTPESTQMRVPEFIENYMTQNKYMKGGDIISDEGFGVGSVEKPTEATLDAIRGLKKG